MPPGKRPTYDMPVFHRHRAAADGAGGAGGAGGSTGAGTDAGAAGDGAVGASSGDGGGEGGGGETLAETVELLSGIYDRNFISSAQARFTEEEDGVPRLTPTQVEALDALDALCDDDRLRLDMRLAGRLSSTPSSFIRVHRTTHSPVHSSAS